MPPETFLKHSQIELIQASLLPHLSIGSNEWLGLSNHHGLAEQQCPTSLPDGGLGSGVFFLGGWFET